MISVGGKSASGSNRMSFKSLNREEVLREMRLAKALRIKEGAIGELERICNNLRNKLPELVIQI
jgi:hypothetical protein